MYVCALLVRPKKNVRNLVLELQTVGRLHLSTGDPSDEQPVLLTAKNFLQFFLLHFLFSFWVFYSIFISFWVLFSSYYISFFLIQFSILELPLSFNSAILFVFSWHLLLFYKSNELFADAFFKLLEVCEEVYDCSFKFCVMEFIYEILIRENFYRTALFFLKKILFLPFVSFAMWLGNRDFFHCLCIWYLIPDCTCWI